MSKKPLILGIETSCDETAASIITENDKGIPTVLSNIVSSQVDVHKEFGGVVPELAARSHIEKIDWIVEKAIADSGKKIEENSNQILEFTQEVKKMDFNTKRRVLEFLWKIILSDNTSDVYESNLMRRICGLLYLPDKLSGEIKLDIIRKNKNDVHS